MKKLLLFFMILVLPFVAEAKNVKSKKSKKVARKGSITFTLHQASGIKVSSGYEVSVFSQKSKKSVSSAYGLDEYYFKLKVGKYDIAVYEVHDQDSPREPLTWYRDIAILPETILHKKLFLNHRDAGDDFSTR